MLLQSIPYNSCLKGGASLYTLRGIWYARSKATQHSGRENGGRGKGGRERGTLFFFSWLYLLIEEGLFIYPSMQTFISAHHNPWHSRNECLHNVQFSPWGQFMDELQKGNIDRCSMRHLKTNDEYFLPFEGEIEVISFLHLTLKHINLFIVNIRSIFMAQLRRHSEFYWTWHDTL